VSSRADQATTACRTALELPVTYLGSASSLGNNLLLQSAKKEGRPYVVTCNHLLVRDRSGKRAALAPSRLRDHGPGGTDARGEVPRERQDVRLRWAEFLLFP
jgi:hypothetical protein